MQAEAEREAMRAAARERQRELRADLEAPDSDTEVEPWARKPIADRSAYFRLDLHDAYLACCCTDALYFGCLVTSMWMMHSF